MNTETITGMKKPGHAQSPLAALSEFYRAFNTQDHLLMQANWCQTDNASMSNPLGGIKRGWEEIKQVYQKIFNGPGKVYVEFYDYSIDETENMFVAVGRERGYIEINDKKIDLAIRTSRIYIRGNQSWKQIHHHGSIAYPDLLQRYQSLVLKTSNGDKDANTIE